MVRIEDGLSLVVLTLPGRRKTAMDEPRRKFHRQWWGGSSLLVIFAVLCLTVFALMSLSTGPGQ